MDIYLRDIAVQMFRDLYLTKIKGKYGECYYMKVPKEKGVYLNIKDTENILNRILLKDLSTEKVLQTYKYIQDGKKVFHGAYSSEDEDGRYSSEEGWVRKKPYYNNYKNNSEYDY
jgi:hypothetical protein